MSDNVAAEQLRLFIERIERLEEEKKGMNDDIRDVYLEAKSQGFDSKTMRSVIKLRKMEKDARDEMDALLETYRKRPRTRLMGRHRHRLGSISVDVEISDLLCEVSDDALREEYADRFGATLAGHDLLEEIYREIMLGRPAYALALIDSAQAASRVDDAQRERQYQMAGRA